MFAKKQKQNHMVYKLKEPLNELLPSIKETSSKAVINDEVNMMFKS